MTCYLGTERTEAKKFCSYCLILNFEIKVAVEQYELNMCQALLQILPEKYTRLPSFMIPLKDLLNILQIESVATDVNYSLPAVPAVVSVCIKNPSIYKPYIQYNDGNLTELVTSSWKLPSKTIY